MSDVEGAVVVGVDGSDGALAAARWAGSLAAQLGTTLHLLHALPGGGWTVTDAAAALQAAMTSYQRDCAALFLNEAADAVRTELPSLRVTTEASETAAVRALIETSRQARLVVLGGEAVSPARAALLGSTTLAVATHAWCPVISWRSEALAPVSGPIVVGVAYTGDGSAALRSAFEIAERFEVELTAVHAWTRSTAVAGVTIPLLIDWDAIEVTELCQLTEVVAEIGRHYPNVKAECFLEPHNPSEAVLRHSAGAGLVVVGTRGRGALTGTVLGSTSLHLLQHSRVPVMVCRDTTKQ